MESPSPFRLSTSQSENVCPQMDGATLSLPVQRCMSMLEILDDMISVSLVYRDAESHWSGICPPFLSPSVEYPRQDLYVSVPQLKG